MGSILKIMNFKNNNFFMKYTIKYLGTILSGILVLITMHYNSSIFIEKNSMIGIGLFFIIISTYLGEVSSGVLTTVFLFVFIENSYYKTVFQLILYVISKIFIIGIINCAKLMFFENDNQFNEKINLYNEILDFISEGILLRKLDKILYANKKFKQYFNKENDESFIGSNILDYLDEQNKEELIEIFTEYYNKPIKQVEFESINGEISSVYLQVNNRKINVKYDDVILSTVNIMTEDVTRLQLIKESKRRYKQILNILPLGVLIHVNNKIIFANNEIAKMLKYGSYKFLIGENIDRFLRYENKIEFYNNIKNLYNEVNIEPIQMYIQDINKSTISVEIVNSIVPFENQAVLTIIKDTTKERKREIDKLLLEETITYEKIKSEFFANVSHELKTPINVIYSSLQVIDSMIKLNKIKDNGYKLKNYINIMKQNCYRELKLANNLIDLSRYELNGFELDLKQINIVSLIENITTEVVKVAKKKNIELIFDTEEEEIFCNVDEMKIERMILNLLSNSIKFTQPNGEIMVFITTKIDSVIITVKDNGIGIPQEKINYIFDRFKQVDKTFTRGNEGSGLGLSIVKAIVNLHGGNLKVESQEGLGTEISISLLCEKDNEQISMGIDNLFKDCDEMINTEFSDIYL